MKKVIMASVLMAVVFASHAEAVAPEPISVNGGKINFTGSIVAAPCAVDNSSESQSVSLGQVATNQLTTKGATTSAVPFTIKLIGCDLSPQVGAPEDTNNYTKASITLSGATVDATTLQVTADSAGQQPATNVGIQIMQANKALNVDGSSNSATQSIIAGENEIPLTATYVATDATVTAGAANSSVNFKVNYE